MAYVVLALVLCAALAGCGGSSAPSRADWGKDVDRICATLDESVRALQRQAPDSTDELVSFADRLGRVVDDGVRKLRAVQRPEGSDGERAKRWLDELGRHDATVVKPALAALEDAAQRRDPAAIRRAVQRIRQADDGRVRALARAAGARGCG
ncbi:MAG TPA: hypothetical protein VF257_05845 [Solirubrobacteraceae bacterium]